MQLKGKITSWNDAKGFGFVTPLLKGDRTFVHINAFAHRGRRPVVGDIITYRLATDQQGRPCAVDASIASVRVSARQHRRTGLVPHALGLAFLLLVAAAALTHAIPMPVLFVYLVASALTYLAYAIDKAAAENGQWRTSEGTLHVLALAGGWPGAVIAQSRLRHKTRKQSFRMVFWVTVVLNCAMLSWLTTADDAARVFAGML